MKENETSRPPKYFTGQRVMIHPVSEGNKSPRDAAIEPFAGKVATVQDYYYIYTPDKHRVFYVYTVRLTTEDKHELVAHEDELKSLLD